MRIEHKRSPAFEDTDLMPFGKYKDEPLSDVPAKYLVWLWNDNIKDYSRNESNIPPSVLIKVKLANYIWNSQDSISQETGESFI